jgi:NitT/TauT family transport system substrate-binding protein
MTGQERPVLTLSRSVPRLLGAAAVLGASLVLVASTVAQAKDKVILQLDWLASGEKSAPYAGMALGYFDAEDIDIEIRRGTGAADSLNKIATRAATYAYCDISNVMMMRPKGVPVKAIFAIDSVAPHAIITRKDTGIKSFKDLPGTILGTAPTASSNLFFPLILADANINAKSIKMVNTEPAALSAMLITKRVDSAMLWLTNRPQLEHAAKEAGVEIVVLPFVAEGMNMYSSILIASDEQLKTKPDLTRRFLRAMKKSYIFMRDNPEKTAEYVDAANPNQQPVPARTEAIKIVNDQLIWTGDLTEKEFGAFEPKLLKDTYAWIGRAQNFEPDRDANEFVDQSLLPR